LSVQDKRPENLHARQQTCTISDAVTMSNTRISRVPIFTLKSQRSRLGPGLKLRSAAYICGWPHMYIGTGSTSWLAKASDTRVVMTGRKMACVSLT